MNIDADIYYKYKRLRELIAIKVAAFIYYLKAQLNLSKDERLDGLEPKDALDGRRANDSRLCLGAVSCINGERAERKN